MPVGGDVAVMSLWPAAQILGDLAHHLAQPGAAAHYHHALTVAEQAGVQPWIRAARERL